MRKNFTFVYLLLLAVQLMLTNYFHVTSYITLTILPVMVFCIPVKTSPSAAMIIAFATGLVVDFFADPDKAHFRRRSL